VTTLKKHNYFAGYYPAFLILIFLFSQRRRNDLDLNDWIIRGVVGEFYPCKPDIFEQTYDQSMNKKAPFGIL